MFPCSILFPFHVKHPNKEIKEIYSVNTDHKRAFPSGAFHSQRNQRCTSDNPGGLRITPWRNMGQELVEKARNQSWNPVIWQVARYVILFVFFPERTKNNPVLTENRPGGKTG